MLPSNSYHNNKDITNKDFTSIPRSNTKVGADTDVAVVVVEVGTMDVVVDVAADIPEVTEMDMDRVITEVRQATMDIKEITTEVVVVVMDMGINIDS